MVLLCVLGLLCLNVICFVWCLKLFVYVKLCLPSWGGCLGGWFTGGGCLVLHVGFGWLKRCFTGGCCVIALLRCGLE